jgi:cytochrome c oxidase accessory protein FixG
VLFDLGARKFYVLGLVFWPQDVIYLSVLLILCALSLFLFTALAGRLWCGYACPQTVYTEIFLWVERKIEGDRLARIRLDAAGWSLEKFVIKALKHTAWLTIALWTGYTFVGYFAPIRDLGVRTISWELGGWEAFWIFFYGFATYGNAGWMREQVCKYMCPYARFQSVMFDRDTLVIAYDAKRGEPRGARSRSTDRAAAGIGDCLDCNICVQVCPTGIDIRNGLQYECIGCAACIDGCDQVMDKMGYPRGLIRYTSENALATGATRRDLWRRALRPRSLAYGGLLMMIAAAAGVALVNRSPLRMDVMRDRGTLAREAAPGTIENVYRVQIVNGDEAPREVRLSAAGIAGLHLVGGDSAIALAPASTRLVAIRLQAPEEAAGAGSHPIEIVVTDAADPTIARREKSTFIFPHSP